MTDPDEQAEVEYVIVDRNALLSGIMCDQPVSVKAAAMLADPEGYFTRVRAERREQAGRQVWDLLGARPDTAGELSTAQYLDLIGDRLPGVEGQP